MYAIICTRSYITFVFGLVSIYQSNLSLSYRKVVKRILRYFKETTHLSLTYIGHDLQLIGHKDVDWGGDLEQRKSTSRYIYIFLLNRWAFSWGHEEANICWFVHYGGRFCGQCSRRGCLVEEIFTIFRNSHRFFATGDYILQQSCHTCLYKRS